MADLHVSLDSSDLNPVERKLQEPLEDQLTSALKHAAAQVAQHYDGRSEDEVVQWLLRETRDALHPDVAEGFQPDEQRMRLVARAVIDGEPIT